MVSTEQLLEDLTDAQRQAVTHVDGPLLIVAGAGSGKTRVITRRVAYLISLGIPASSILAITFTNKAAGEMKERVGHVMGRPVRDFGRLDQPWPTICTFHSLCLRILRHYAPRLGLSPNFSVFDTADQMKLIKEAIKGLEISSTNFPPSTVHATISNAKNQLADAAAFAQAAGDFYQRNVARIYTKYQQLLEQNNALDFDDLLLRTAHAFRDHPDVLAELQNRYHYLLIDEYQDTNHAQYILAHALAQKHRNLCVVGDPDQCLPPGTLVQTPDGPRRVETVAEGGPVTSAKGWGGTTTMPIEKVMRSQYRGPLVRLTTDDGAVIRATPNHIVFGKLRPDASLHYTYLMWRRGIGYRIGTTRGVRTSKDREIASGLQVRTNQEVADAVWVLHCSRSSAEARFYEHYYSVRYGIPTMVFFVRGRRMDMTQDWVDRLYREIDTEEAAERLMAELHLDPRFPHHRPGAVTRLRGGVDGAGWARRPVLFTVFGDSRPFSLKPWHEHRVQLVTSGDELRASAAEKFRVRDGVRGAWRIETSRKDYDAGLKLARDVCALCDDMEVVSRARLSQEGAFLFMPVSHVHPGMVVPVLREGRVEEALVAERAWEEYDGPVYDLSVPNTRNYVAGGFVVHNSIYAWRGADISNILDFERDYPDAKVVRLEQNYRSTKAILAIASKLIANNLHRKDKALWTHNADGEPATLYLCQDEHDEAAVITRELREMNEKHGVPWNDMAIFYRMNSLSRVMEESLFKAKVPYQIARGVEFYNRKEIKDVLAYLRVIANPADEVSLTRVVNTPARGLGDSSVKLFAAHAVATGKSLFDALADAGSVTGVTARAANAARGFAQMVQRCRSLASGEVVSNTDIFSSSKGPVQAIMEDVVRTSGLEAMYRKAGDEEQTELNNINELISSAAEYDRDNPGGSLQEYLANVSLVSDADHMKGGGGAVTLMTLHAAKGLEFPVVAMIGLEEGILPHSRTRGNLDELEEERRLSFVGITRAQKRLILSKAALRTVRGLRGRTVTSPFLNEMPPEFLRVIDRTSLESLEDRSAARALERDRAEGIAGQFRRGQMVRHPTFGVGRIAELSQTGQHTRAVVEFAGAGRKTLVLQYARLEPVG